MIRRLIARVTIVMLKLVRRPRVVEEALDGTLRLVCQRSNHFNRLLTAIARRIVNIPSIHLHVPLGKVRGLPGHPAI